jgi:dihydropteroate synthase
MYWQTSRRQISLDRPLVMAILNVTPDSFSDGGQLVTVDDVLRQAERVIAEGADILDIGGESTRPGSSRVPVDDEIRRVVPAIEAIAKRFDVPISIDTSKAQVATSALAAGAEIINDISGLRFDERIGEVAAATGAGLVLMHSRGEFEQMHRQPPVSDVLGEVGDTFRIAIAKAKSCGVADECIALDVGIGFSKTQDQNLELLAKLGKLAAEFHSFPILVGASRKSFIGKILGESDPTKRISGSIAAAVIAVMNGGQIVRVHDVKKTRDALTIASRIRSFE